MYVCMYVCMYVLGFVWVLVCLCTKMNVIKRPVCCPIFYYVFFYFCPAKKHFLVGIHRIIFSRFRIWAPLICIVACIFLKFILVNFRGHFVYG